MILREGRSPAPVNNRALQAMQMQTNKAKRMPPSVSCDRPAAHGCLAQQLREAPHRAQRDRFSARPSARGGCSPRLLLQCGGPAAPGYECMAGCWRGGLPHICCSGKMSESLRPLLMNQTPVHIYIYVHIYRCDVSSGAQIAVVSAHHHEAGSGAFSAKSDVSAKSECEFSSA